MVKSVYNIHQTNCALCAIGEFNFGNFIILSDKFLFTYLPTSLFPIRYAIFENRKDQNKYINEVIQRRMNTGFLAHGWSLVIRH